MFPRFKPLTASRHRSLAASVLISVLTVTLILSLVRLDLRQCGAMLARLDLAFLMGVTLLYLAPFPLRALRLRLLLPAPVGLARLQETILLHQFYANFLPLKVGELALPIMLKRDGVRRAQTIGVLIVARLMDLAAATSLFAAALFTFLPQLPTSLARLWPVALGAVLLTGVIVIFCVGLARWHRGTSAPAGPGKSTDASSLPTIRLAWLRDRLSDMRLAMRSLSPGRLFAGLLLTVSIWVLVVVFGVFFCQRMVPSLSLEVLTVLCLALPVLSQLPIHGLAGIGTTEGLMVVVFGLGGLAFSDALSLGIVSHVVQLGLVLLIGLIGFALGRPAAAVARES